MGAREATVVQFRTFRDERGKLTVAEHLPFEVKRLFWIYEVTGLDRGGHAHKECEQMIVAVHGGFDVILDDRSPIKLVSPHFGMHVPPGHKITLANWDAGSVALVMCSHEYDEDEYVRPVR